MRDVEEGTSKDESVFFEEEKEQSWWVAPFVNPNKGDVSNFVTFLVFLVGILLRILLGRDNWVASLVLAFGLFGFAGGVTNSIAVTMLFDKIPLLVGSGVIPRRFKDILSALKTMILDTFFEESFLKQYLTERSSDLAGSLDIESRIEKAVDGGGAGLGEKLEQLSQTPDGMLLATLLPMFGDFGSMATTMQPIIKAVGVELAKTLVENFDATEVVDVAQVRAEIDRALSQRMTMLTPAKVKRMMSKVIRDHLGWLVVWGNVFGGLIGVISWIARY